MTATAALSILAAGVSITASFVRLMSDQWKLRRAYSRVALGLAVASFGAAVVAVFIGSRLNLVAPLLVVTAYVCTSVPLIVAGLAALSPPIRDRVPFIALPARILIGSMLVVGILVSVLLWRLVAQGT
jgi:hypothetical protein